MIRSAFYRWTFFQLVHAPKDKYCLKLLDLASTLFLFSFLFVKGGKISASKLVDKKKEKTRMNVCFI